MSKIIKTRLGIRLLVLCVFAFITAIALMPNPANARISLEELLQQINDLQDQLAQMQLHLVPVGTIVMWSGSVEEIPEGWALCDGSGGTPDLTDKFIVGAGFNYDIAAEGGADEVTLDITNMPTHSHDLSGVTTTASGSHNHAIISLQTSAVVDHRHGVGSYTISYVDNHRHSYTDLYWSTRQEAREGIIGSTVDAANDDVRTRQADTAWAGGHSHGLSGSSAYAGGHSHTVDGDTELDGEHVHALVGSTAETGDSEPLAILPPYYALAFIIKVEAE